jgi:hypothetical protein
MDIDLIFGLVMIGLTFLIVGASIVFKIKPDDEIGGSNGRNCFNFCVYPNQTCSTVCSYGWQ